MRLRAFGGICSCCLRNQLATLNLTRYTSCYLLWYFLPRYYGKTEWQRESQFLVSVLLSEISIILET